MRLYRFSIYCVAVLMVEVLAFGGAAAAEPGDDATAARVGEIIKAATRTEAIVRNLFCSARFDDWRRQGTKEQEFPGDTKGWTRRREWGSYGWNDRGCVHLDQDFYYAGGPNKNDRTPVKVMKTWNGIEERDAFNGGQIVISEKNMARAVRTPIDFARVDKESVAAFLGRALKGRWPLKLAENSASTWTLTVQAQDQEGADEFRLTLDPAKGYYLTGGERRRSGVLLERWESTPQECYTSGEKIAPGIWFPKRGRWQTFVEKAGRSVLDTECELLVRNKVFVYPDGVKTVPSHYSLRTDQEMISDSLGRPLPELIRYPYFGSFAYPDSSHVMARFDLPATEFERFFDGQGHCPASKDFQTDHTGNRPVNGSLRDFFNLRMNREDGSGAFVHPWWRPEELPAPLFAWKEEITPRSNPRYVYRARYLFAVGQENRGFRRVYCLFIWTD